MSAEAVGWVFRHSPLKGAGFAVHLAIADSVNDQHGNELWMRQAVLATKARTTRGTVGRTLAAMVEGTTAHPPLLELIRETNGKANLYRFLYPDIEVAYETRGSVGVRAERAGGVSGARTHLRAERAPTCAQSAHITQERSQAGSQEDPSATPAALPLAGIDPPEPAAGSIARALVSRVWDRSNPKPATPFIAAVKIAERLLAAGWTEPQVEDAMVTAPTISTGAVELALARALPARGVPRGAPVTTRRDGPEGRVKL